MKKIDWEAEIACAISKRGRHIKAEDALSHIAGYTCFCDATVRLYEVLAGGVEELHRLGSARSLDRHRG